MFKEALRDLVERTDGGLAGLLMDSNGITVESYNKEGAGFDITAVGVEFGVVLSSIKRAAEMLEAGATKEVVITTDQMTTLVRVLSDTYFLALAVRPDGNSGKGRYLMRTVASQLLAELS